MHKTTHFFLSVLFLAIGFWSFMYLGITYLPRIFAQPTLTLISPFDETSELEVVPKIPPVQISFPSLDLIQPIKPASVVGNQWDTYEDAVSWLNTSETPNRGGNVVLFGHNKKHLLSKMKNLEVGDTILITSQTGEKVYQVLEKVEVVPTVLDYVLNTEDRLTIYTCSGPFDSRRLFVIAVPLQV